jgi:hypothetical protein
LLTDCVAHVGRHLKWWQFVAWVLDGIAHGNPLLRFDTPPPLDTECTLSHMPSCRCAQWGQAAGSRGGEICVLHPLRPSLHSLHRRGADVTCLVGAVVPRGGGAVGGRGGGRGRGATKRFRRGREGAVAVRRGWRLLFVCVNCVCFYVETNTIYLVWKPGRGWDRALLGRERRARKQRARHTHALPYRAPSRDSTLPFHSERRPTRSC